MSTIDQIRAELLELLDLEGFAGYAYTPGAPQLPALVLALPDEITPGEGSIGLTQIRQPVWVCAPHPFTAAAETALMGAVLEVIARIRANPTGAHARARHVLNVDRTGSMTIGAAEATVAAVNVSLLAHLTPT